MVGRRRWVWLLAGGGVVGTALVVLLVLGHQSGTPANRAVRSAALLGYMYIFFGVISSAFLRQLVHFFGRPFIKIHHMIAMAGTMGVVVITVFVRNRISRRKVERAA